MRKNVSIVFKVHIWIHWFLHIQVLDQFYKIEAYLGSEGKYDYQKYSHDLSFVGTLILAVL